MSWASIWKSDGTAKYNDEIEVVRGKWSVLQVEMSEGVRKVTVPGIVVVKVEAEE